ncbi:KOW motif-containing protein [Candidatus Karelsulcia muelleri]
MKIKNKDNILINSGPYKGKKGKVLKIRKKKTRALVEILNKDECRNKFIDFDLSNLLLIYRPFVLKSNTFEVLQKQIIQLRKMNKKINDLFSIEELNNFLKIRDLENIKPNELLP